MIRKKTIFFTLLCGLGAGAPALAQSFQHAQPAAQQGNRVHERAPVRADEPASAGEGEKAKAAHEEEEGIPPINLFDFSNPEQPPYGVMVINFLILMTMYYVLGRKPLAEGLKARRLSIAREIEEAQKMRREAEARAEKYQEKLKHLEQELRETRDSMHAAGEVERERIVHEAEEKAARMEKDAKFLVEQEMKQMRVELLKEAVDLASVAAEELLKKRITAADQERLAEDYLIELMGKRPSGPMSVAPQSAAGGAE